MNQSTNNESTNQRITNPRINESTERGAALITTLLICMVMMTICLGITHLIRGKIGLAGEVKQGLEAEIQAQNLAQKALFQLSTHRFEANGIAWTQQDVAHDWPFDRRIIAVDGGKLAVQDTHGVLPLCPLRYEPLERLLLQRGIDASDVRIFIDSLKDWVDADGFKHLNGAEAMDYTGMGVEYQPRNEHPQSKTELGLIRGMTPEIRKILDQALATTVGYGVNPLTLPESLVPVLLDGDASRIQQLLALRKKGQLTYRNFLILFPEYSDSMEIGFFPSRRLIVTTQATVGKVSVAREMTVLFQERRNTPFRIQNQQIRPGGSLSW